MKASELIDKLKELDPDSYVNGELYTNVLNFEWSCADSDFNSIGLNTLIIHDLKGESPSGYHIYNKWKNEKETRENLLHKISKVDEFRPLTFIVDEENERT